MNNTVPLSKKRARRFFFHYNKPASAAAGIPKLSVHYAKACHIVDGIDCRVPIRSKNNKKQPRCVMAGKCGDVTIVDGIAVIQ